MSNLFKCVLTYNLLFLVSKWYVWLYIIAIIKNTKSANVAKITPICILYNSIITKTKEIITEAIKNLADNNKGQEISWKYFWQECIPKESYDEAVKIYEELTSQEQEQGMN